MKQNIFKYVAIAAALLATAVNAGAQTYNHENGVSTSKQVTGPDTNGNYTIRLETFATGTTTVTETNLPADIALVLDLSTSMNVPRGTTTPVTSKNLTYNDVVNARTSATNYLFNNYQLFGEVYTAGGQTRYYLYYNSSGSNTRNYIYRDRRNRIRTTTDRNDALYATSPSGTIASFPGASGSHTLSTGSSRIFALKEAVCAFIGTINEQDINEDNTRVGHKISILTFESDVTKVQELASVEDIDLEGLKEKVWAFSLRTGTQPSEGIDEANSQLSTNGHTGTLGTDFSRTVVVFTDGDPYDEPKYNGVKSAYASKNTYNATVYTVGMFSSSPSTNSDLYRFMNYMSSQFPKANLDDNNNMIPGEGGSFGNTYYKDASSASVDLTAIFTEIAQSAGGASATIGTSTQVRDVVTNSFVLPDNVTAANVHVYTSTATGAASGEDDTDPAGWTTPVEITSSVTPRIVDVDANGEPTNDPDKVKNKALFIEGFDYSKDDTAEGEGDGNWVGPRYKDGNWTWAGKKVIIEFKVKANGEATGGESQTNTGNSGVWVQNEDGTYTCINHYAEPHTTLTVNIKIRKTGLRSGESATFELMRIRPKGYNPDGATLKDRVANLEYNLIGKPKPGTHESTDPSLSPTDADPSDYYKSIGWEGFKKVILTNLSDVDGKEVIKDVLALDPYWVYMVVEDDWGWAYTMTGDANQVGEDGTYTTSTVEVNPFRFHNTEKTGVVKHAEAVMINHFQSVEEGASSYTEHKKSSKVEHFD